MEVTERNSNLLEASFELFLQLAELEQPVYAAHYDRDPVSGNPGEGWVKVGLIAELSHRCGAVVSEKAQQLKLTWSEMDPRFSQVSGATSPPVGGSSPPCDPGVIQTG